MNGNQEKMKVFFRKTVVFLLVFMLSHLIMPMTTAKAQSYEEIVGVSVQEEKINFFVRNAPSKIKEISVQLGNKLLDYDDGEWVKNSDVQINTLILLDNSASIDKDGQKRAFDAIRAIIENRLENENIALAVSSEHLETLSNYIRDQAKLKDVLSSVRFYDHRVYLPNAIHEGLESVYKKNMENGGLGRLVVLSDGADFSDSAYTLSEIQQYIQETNTQVYPCITNYAKTTTDSVVQDMTSLARVSKGEFLDLAKKSSATDVKDALMKAADYLYIRCSLEKEELDGTQKTVRLTLTSDAEEIPLEQKITMPLKDIVSQTSENAKSTDTEDKKETTATTDETKDSEKGMKGFFNSIKNWIVTNKYLVAIVALCIVAAVVIFYVIRAIMKNKKRVKQASHAQDSKASRGDYDEEYTSFEMSQSSPFRTNADVPPSFEKNQRYWDGEDSYHEDDHSMSFSHGATEVSRAEPNFHDATEVSRGVTDSAHSSGEFVDPDEFDLDKTVIDFDGREEKTVVLDSAWMKYPIVKLVSKKDGKEYENPIENEILIGRSKRKIGEYGIVIEGEPTISGVHCKIIRKDDKYYIRDMESANGTFLNGRYLAEESEIHSGDTIKMARGEFEFSVTPVNR